MMAHGLVGLIGMVVVSMVNQMPLIGYQMRILSECVEEEKLVVVRSFSIEGIIPMQNPDT